MDNLMTAEERRDAWMENQFQHGDDPHYWDYAQWIAELLQRALDLVEDLVGERHAAEPLMQLLAPVAAIEGTRKDTWREVMEDVFSAGTVWPIGEDFNHALLYGLYGVTPARIAVQDRAGWIADLVGRVTEFAAHPEVQALGVERNPIVMIANLAASRHAMDRGQGEVDIHSMSVLGAVSEGRLRNLLAGEGAQLERGPNGGVVALSALTWLQKRKGFLASIWNEAESEPEARPEPVDPGRMIFVPVARDGSMFTPDLQRAGQYQIGAKGDEQHFDTYEQALEALNAMPVPRWRRPNAQGNWGIVTGVAWQRVKRA
ncbi:hypothetical protein [Jhaorihella thermophila]|uniref:Uncharacterized protein n=1 Tax=Jhaorihella thermophila TaxID=488547 RepID=A0A1H5YK92_9RHOB|nr:hypothetical protein [Jhaorihella thermophila]SEG24140.1 hypothetical protein SAMN05421751_11930 [Jhaorihella thermophila]